MLKYFRVSAFALALVLVITSCKKSDPVTDLPAETSGQKLLSKQIVRIVSSTLGVPLGTDTFYYIRDNRGRLTEIIHTSTATPPILGDWSATMMYDTNTIAGTKTVASQSAVRIFHYNVEEFDNGLKVIITQVSNGMYGEDSLISTYAFSDSVLQSAEMYYHDAGIASGTYNMLYSYNADGNADYFERGKTRWTVTMWDSQQNFYRYMPKSEYLLFHHHNFSFLGKNNPVKMRADDEQGVVNEWDLQYEYNEEGFPTKMTMKPSFGSTIEYSYFYTGH